jgi:hypothetical protein
MTTNPTRYAYDLEFLEDGITIDLISIGIACEDGREYYAVSNSFDVNRVLNHDWLRANVWPYLPTAVTDGRPVRQILDWAHPDVKSRRQIAPEVGQFLTAAGEPELWADFGAYDHVGLMQLWGPMVTDNKEKPCLPWYTNDIQQERLRLERHFTQPITLPEQKQTEHHALADARHNLEKMRWLRQFSLMYDLAGAL